MTFNQPSSMHRRKFIGLTLGGALLGTGATAYLLSDKRNLQRADFNPADEPSASLQPYERQILDLAALAPSDALTLATLPRTVPAARAAHAVHLSALGNGSIQRRDRTLRESSTNRGNRCFSRASNPQCSNRRSAPSKYCANTRS